MSTNYEDDLRRLLDIQEIQQVLHMYSIAIDSRDPEAMLPLFTEDAVIQVGDLEEMPVEQYALGGKEFLPTLEVTQHAISTAVIEIDGDTAKSRSYFAAQHSRNSLGDNCMLVIGGHYDDDFVRFNGQWRIKKRIGTATWMDGNIDVLAGAVGNIGGQPWTGQREYPGWLKNRLATRSN